ncbi:MULTISPECIES: hydrogenase iron-sulfur subunit [sulfur-oxidizing symbionts]|jgi:coenzyme F420-reducing hydrogenase delta subunit|nr:MULTISPECIES: hydrogenase iron-sulfur subunit [sulfur-oxidizing symbionts]EGV50290.1 putative methyl-viologen-reducing hydrogenase, delta subunit [endosymbiont of Riftia pachyptila (vent Ph05)]USF86849.1 hydrogenase iron-sulfur subunit [Candidatus Endoriftia persephone]
MIQVSNSSQSTAAEPQEFEPRIVAFLCKWCSSAGSDLAGVSRIQYPANATPITIPCSGAVSPMYILSAFNKGADGVLVSGCHPGDCHYMEGNFLSRRKLYLVRNLLQFIGLESDRFRMSWVSAAEGAKFAEVVEEFVSDLRTLGPQNRLAAQRRTNAAGAEGAEAVRTLKATKAKR